MGKQRRFVLFAEGEGYSVRGAAALRREIKNLTTGDYPVTDLVVYEGLVGDSKLLLVANPKEV